MEIDKLRKEIEKRQRRIDQLLQEINELKKWNSESVLITFSYYSDLKTVNKIATTTKNII